MFISVPSSLIYYQEISVMKGFSIFHLNQNCKWTHYLGMESQRIEASRRTLLCSHRNILTISPDRSIQMWAAHNLSVLTDMRGWRLQARCWRETAGSHSTLSALRPGSVLWPGPVRDVPGHHVTRDTCPGTPRDTWHMSRDTTWHVTQTTDTCPGTPRDTWHRLLTYVLRHVTQATDICPETRDMWHRTL